MQGLEFGRQLERIVRDLHIEKILKILNPFFNPNESNFVVTPQTKTEFADLLFDIDGVVTSLAADPRTSPILEELNIAVLLDRNTRTLLLTAFQNATHKEQIFQSRMFWYLYHSIAAVKAIQRGFSALVLDPKTKVRRDTDAIIELWIDDYDGEPLKVDRLEAVLSSLRILYEATSESLGIEKRSATIAYTDSGTKFTVALEGVGDAIRAVGDLFGDAWRAIRFRKNEKVERDMDTLRDQLTLVTEIRQKVARNDLDNETGTRLEHMINTSMIQLLEKGVLPATVDTYDEYDRKEVLGAVRDTPLLGPGQPPAPGNPDVA